MGFNFDRFLSIITFAGIAGLIILNASSATKVLEAASSATNSYITTVQGRGASG